MSRPRSIWLTSSDVSIPTRTVNPYLFAGVGLNYAFNNDEAVALNDAGYTMDNIWSDSKTFAVGRMGVGVNFRVSNRVQLGLEVNANILSDKFNSKKAGNVDWHFNALAGLSIRLGKSHRKAAVPAAVPATPVKPAEPAETPQEPETQPAPEQPAPTPTVEKPQPLRENIFFRIGKTNIREEEQPKIRSLVDYLKKNAAATVRITGYADAATAASAAISSFRSSAPATFPMPCSKPASRPTASASTTKATPSNRSLRLWRTE